MRVALCVDHRNGFTFQGRRLSRDRAQQEDLLSLCGGEPLRITPYSAPLFSCRGTGSRWRTPCRTAPSAFWRTACLLWNR